MYHFNDEYLLNVEKKFVCNPLCTNDLSRQFNTPPFHDFFRMNFQILLLVQFKSARENTRENSNDETQFCLRF